jgi:EAL domain-containing protein (putative c-di-GMP-specific phosphodiesterase class I)
VNRVRRTLERTGLAPDRLELEVTESMIMRRPDAAIATLDALRALGVILALDDFGTGHSSLTYLKRLPVNRIKMDKSFVKRLGEDRDDEAIARAVIALGRSIGLGVIAEGIETRTQHDFLRDEFCDEGQGYLYGRPLAAGMFMESWSMMEGSMRLSPDRTVLAPESES